VSLNFLLVPRWGAVGAALATSTTLIVFNVIMWRLVKLRTGLDSSPVFRRRA
jgi:O-antigen/teichoic acid export membrane protein